MRAETATAAATEPRERGILFTGPNVLKCKAGTKTQTRRIVKPQPRGRVGTLRASNGTTFLQEWDGASGMEFRCPYGSPGQQLWVRESWASSTKGVVAYRADGWKGAIMGDGDGGRIFLHHAWILEVEKTKGPSVGLAVVGGRWRPSIHMPRWASRLTLEITEVRVERLQEISEEDAKAEGAVPGKRWADSTYPPRRTEHQYKVPETHIEAFARSWKALHGDGAWDANPWCWAISFRRVAVEGGGRG